MDGPPVALCKINTHSGAGVYGATQVRWDTKTETYETIYSGDVLSEEPLYELNGNQNVPVGTGDVFSFWCDEMSGGKFQFVFANNAIAYGHFAVKVWQDGGTTDGDLTNKCNRTYEVRTMEATALGTGGTELGTDMTPVQNRPALGKLVCPATTGAGVVGAGYYDEDGDFQLWSANEAFGSGACA